jgi:uncharacterized protein
VASGADRVDFHLRLASQFRPVTLPETVLTEYLVRRLLIDLEQPFARHWNGGDAFRTAFFNALSMSFPVGEQFFIDSVRAGLGILSPAERQRFAVEVKGFIGQEATHRRIHSLFNQQLIGQGYRNTWEPRIVKRNEGLVGMDPRHPVAITAATEHFTTIFAEHLLRYPQVLAGSEVRLQTLWLWHASEESEHRSTAIDVYRAMGGSEKWRRRWMLLSSFFFLTDLARQTAANLQRDGQLWRSSTWASAARFLFGREHGLVRKTVGPWRSYFRKGFHPTDQVSPRGAQWLADNAHSVTALGSQG